MAPGYHDAAARTFHSFVEASGDTSRVAVVAAIASAEFVAAASLK